MSNSLDQGTSDAICICLALGFSIRKTAATVRVNKNTVLRHRGKWVEKMLQFAYDVLWDSHGEWCDNVTAMLPQKPVTEMLDAWLDDQFEEKKSRWH